MRYVFIFLFPVPFVLLASWFLWCYSNVCLFVCLQGMRDNWQRRWWKFVNIIWLKLGYAWPCRRRHRQLCQSLRRGLCQSPMPRAKERGPMCHAMLLLQARGLVRARRRTRRGLRLDVATYVGYWMSFRLLLAGRFWPTSPFWLQQGTLWETNMVRSWTCQPKVRSQNALWCQYLTPRKTWKICWRVLWLRVQVASIMWGEIFFFKNKNKFCRLWRKLRRKVTSGRITRRFWCRGWSIFREVCFGHMCKSAPNLRRHKQILWQLWRLQVVWRCKNNWRWQIWRRGWMNELIKMLR